MFAAPSPSEHPVLRVDPALKHSEFCKHKISELLLPLHRGAREGKLCSGVQIPFQRSHPSTLGVGVVQTCPEPAVSGRFALLFQWCQHLATQKLQLENKTPGLITRGNNVAESWAQLPFSTVNTNKLPLINGVGCRWCFVQ